MAQTRPAAANKLSFRSRSPRYAEEVATIPPPRRLRCRHRPASCVHASRAKTQKGAAPTARQYKPTHNAEAAPKGQRHDRGKHGVLAPDQEAKVGRGSATSHGLKAFRRRDDRRACVNAGAGRRRLAGGGRWYGASGRARPAKRAARSRAAPRVHMRAPSPMRARAPMPMAASATFATLATLAPSASSFRPMARAIGDCTSWLVSPWPASPPAARAEVAANMSGCNARRFATWAHRDACCLSCVAKGVCGVGRTLLASGKRDRALRWRMPGRRSLTAFGPTLSPTQGKSGRESVTIAGRLRTCGAGATTVWRRFLHPVVGAPSNSGGKRLAGAPPR